MSESILVKMIKIFINSFLIIICFVISAIGIAILFNYFIFKPIYEVQTQLLVNHNSNDQIPYSWDVVETDLQLINTYNVIIKSPAILNRVINELDLKISQETLIDKITLLNEENSKVINIVVEDESHKQAVEIANKIANVFQEEIPSLMSVDNINILSEAKISANPIPVKPNKTINIIISAILGLMLGIGLAFILEYFNTKIKTEQDIEEIISLPILGVVSSIQVPNLVLQSSLPPRGKRRKK